MWYQHLKLLPKVADFKIDLKERSSSFTCHVLHSLAYMLRLHARQMNDALASASAPSSQSSTLQLFYYDLRTYVQGFLTTLEDVPFWEPYVRLAQEESSLSAHSVRESMSLVLSFGVQHTPSVWLLGLRYLLGIAPMKHATQKPDSAHQHAVDPEHRVLRALVAVAQSEHHRPQPHLRDHLVNLTRTMHVASATQSHALMDVLLRLLTLYPIHVRYKMGTYMTNGNAPFQKGIQFTERWRHTLTWLSHIQGTISKNYFTTLCAYAPCWRLSGYSDVGPLLIHKVHDMHGDERGKMFIAFGMLEEASRHTATIPLSVSLSELSTLLGKALTPGHWASLDKVQRNKDTHTHGLFVLQFRLRCLHSQNVILRSIDVRGPALMRIRVNGTAATERSQLRNGDVLAISISQAHTACFRSTSCVDATTTHALTTQPHVEDKTPILLWESNDLVCYMKPSDCAIVAFEGEDTRGDTIALVDTFQQYLEQNKKGSPPSEPFHSPPKLGMVHRLDRGVSGLCLFVTNRPSALSISAQLKFRTLHRKYIAICLMLHPTVPIKRHGHGVIQTSHRTTGATGRKVMVTNASDGKAITRYRVLEHYEACRVVFLECELQSGKRHQIRAHLASVGLPILGDHVYGGAIVSFPVPFQMYHHSSYRIFLHAYHIQFQTLDGESRILETTIPKRFRDFLNILS